MERVERLLQVKQALSQSRRRRVRPLAHKCWRSCATGRLVTADRRHRRDVASRCQRDRRLADIDGALSTHHRRLAEIARRDRVRHQRISARWKDF